MLEKGKKGSQANGRLPNSMASLKSKMWFTHNFKYIKSQYQNNVKRKSFTKLKKRGCDSVKNESKVLTITDKTAMCSEWNKDWITSNQCLTRSEQRMQICLGHVNKIPEFRHILPL